MALISLKCPNCGGTIEDFDVSKNKGTCPFCDSVITDVPVKEQQPAKVNGVINTISNESNKITSYLTLAETALEAKNYAEAEKYSNMAIELDHENAQGWFIKGKSSGWQSNAFNHRMNEVALNFVNAIKYADKTDISFKTKIIDEYKSLVKSLVDLHTRLFSESPDESRKNKVKLTIGEIYSCFKIFIEKSGLTIETDDVFQFMVQNINSAVNQAYKNALNNLGKDKSKKTPSAWVNYVNTSDNCMELLEYAIELSEHDPDSDFQLYKNLIFIQESVIKSEAYSYDSEKKKYVVAKSLDWRDKSDRKIKIKKWKEEAHEVDPTVRKLRAEEAAKKEKIEKYWSDHPQEKSALDNEIKALEESLSTTKKGFLGTLSKDGKQIKAQIDSLKAELVKDR